MAAKKSEKFNAQLMRDGFIVFLKGLLIVMICFVMIWTIGGAFAQTVDSKSETQQPFYSRAISWVSNTAKAVGNWVEKQASRLAQAFSDETVSELATGQILGETVESSAKESPPESKVDSTPPSAIPVESAEPSQESVIQEGSIVNEPPIEAIINEITEAIPEPEVELPLPDEPREEPDVIEGTIPEVVEKKTEEPVEQSPPQPTALPFPIHQPDQIAPTSQVLALAATTTSASFEVAWSGEDNRGSNVFFDVEYQVDSGDWTAWLSEHVLFTSAFTGAADESTYGFRTRARDAQGNWEEFPESADTTTYINLSVPTDPVVTSHTNGATIGVEVDEDVGVSDVQVTLSGTGDANDTLVIALSETSTIATTTISSLGVWSQQFTLVEDTNTFSLQATEADGDSSSAVSFALELLIIPTLDVVINEISWMGTAASTGDEWLELYNASSTPIDLTSWTLIAKDNTPSITISGICSNTTIQAKSYYLLEKTNDDTVSDITADCIYGGTEVLGDSGELLSLRDSTSTLVDRVGSSTADWFAGDKDDDITMERIDPTTSGTESGNWANNDETLVNGQDADSNSLKATPGSLNSVNTTIPRTITDLTFQYIHTTSTSTKLYWTAPKTANLATTTPATYDIRHSSSAITDANFSSATQVTGEPTPSITEGTAQTLTVSGLTASTTYYFAVKTNNGVEDSFVSNSKDIATLQAGGGSYTTLGAGFPSGTGGLVASSSSPYLVTASMTVPNGATLTIEPGTVLKMGGNYTITVNGSMVMGDADDPINGAVITSEDDDSYGGIASGSGGTPAVGDWGRIVAGTAASQLNFNNAILRFGGFSTSLVGVSGGAQATTTRSIIEQSNSTGISVNGDASILVLTDSIVRDHYRGVEIDTLANATITGTTFTGTSPGQSRGIEIDSNADVANIFITGNNFFANNRNVPSPSSGIRYEDTDTLLPAANIANNWWGANTGPTQNSHSILDDIDGIIDAGGVVDTLTDVEWPVTFATSQITIKPSGL
jgi:hypothetical protein